jgi:hypothetical protein
MHLETRSTALSTRPALGRRAERRRRRLAEDHSEGLDRSLEQGLLPLKGVEELLSEATLRFPRHARPISRAQSPRSPQLRAGSPRVPSRVVV